MLFVVIMVGDSIALWTLYENVVFRKQLELQQYNNNIIIIFILYNATSIIVRGASQHITIKRHKNIYVYNKTNTSVLK